MQVMKLECATFDAYHNHAAAHLLNLVAIKELAYHHEPL
jgi:hypothetical protein